MIQHHQNSDRCVKTEKQDENVTEAETVQTLARKGVAIQILPSITVKIEKDPSKQF